ncbi:MAG: serine hydrolase domain-containing protein [Pseudomonadota bacterium]
MHFAKLSIAGSLLLTSCAIKTDHAQTDTALSDIVKSLRTPGEIPALVLSEFSCTSRSLAWEGTAKLGSETEIKETSRFAIGSNAKSFLATAAIRIGADLDAPLSETWPEVASRAPEKSSITLRQLFSHSSGLPAFDTGKALNAVPSFTGSDATATARAAVWFLEQPLAAEPGTQTVYSNAGYVVAGAILERLFGRPFHALIEDEVFKPLGLEGAFGEPRLLEDKVFGHYVSEGAITPYTETDPPIPPFLEAAGNVVLSMPDYVTYLQAHLCGLQGESSDFLDKDKAVQLHVSQLENGAGLGWGKTELGGVETSFHIGGTGDFTAFAALAPDRDQGVAALMNVGGAPAGGVQAWVIETMSADP